MTLIVPAVLGGLALTVMALVSLAAARRGRHPALPQNSIAQVRILVHSINDDRCTGCDACVAVCPTNVLDLVDNKSRVLRFQDCIQCEACMWACPTEALVMHLEGTEPPPLKVPELDEYFQTAVPGQYLIGEVAGKPLVKNAANLGRLVVEHMLRAGLQPGALAGDPSAVDVVIVGSGPGGLSAALSCVQRGVSYVVLDKEQIVASTIARYPKGKLVMAEPYDVRNVSLLPVFDSSKEQLIPIWQELQQRVGMQIRLGEAVEDVALQGDGTFQIRSTVGIYRAQRVILATGTRGKPRTIGAPGENLPKIHSLLDDPDDFRGKPVIVVGGGDSAVEAAIALADAGARVILSYRGRSFNRAAPKNKQTIESYEAQRRVKIRYQSNVIEFTQDTVTLQMLTGQRKTYPNEAGFVLIGSDPPIKWLEQLGVQFVERPHSYQLGKSDEILAAMLGQGVVECPEDAASAAAVILGQAMPQLVPEQQSVSRPRRWLRSATAIFTASHHKLEKKDAVPLSEFASRARRRHTGQGRRDSLDPSERTRVLRMLRDEGGRIADEESRIDIPALPPPQLPDDHGPPQYLDDPPAPPPTGFSGPGPGGPGPGGPGPGSQKPISLEDGLSPKPAVIVGLDRARANRNSPSRRGAGRPAPSEQAAPPAMSFADEPTQQVDADSALAKLLRDQSRQPNRNGAGQAPASVPVGDDPDDDPTVFDDPLAIPSFEEPTRAVDAVEMLRRSGQYSAANMGDTSDAPGFETDPTKAINVNKLTGPSRVSPRRKKIRYPDPDDEATRALDLDRIQQGESLSDIDWDLD